MLKEIIHFICNIKHKYKFWQLRPKFEHPSLIFGNFMSFFVSIFCLVIVMGKKGVMFQISWGTSVFDAVWSPEHFDTFFYWNRPKNETVPSKKLNRTRGVCGGSWKWQFGPNILLYTILCWFWCCVVSFCGQRIHLWKFWENQTIRIRKNGRLSPNWRRKALCV